MDIKKLVRKEVLNFSPYIPGKPISELKRELGIENIYKLASNENSIGVPKSIFKNFDKVLENAYRYPDSNCFILRDELSKKINIKKENFLFGNGSDEIIELMGKTFLNKEDEIIMSEHSFIRYKMSADLMGAKTLFAKMTNDFVVDLKKILKLITEKTKIIFIGNPNNPTGTYVKKDDFEKFLKLVPENILIFMDEAYCEFASDLVDYPDSLKLQKKYKNLLVSKTFSKFFALAGIRVGYLIGDEEIISYINRIRPPFNVNIIAQNIAINATNDEEHKKNTLKMIKEGREYFYSEFKKMKIKFFKTAGNFILFFAGKLGGKKLFKECLKKGIIIRAVDEYDLKEFARVSIGTKIENENFFKVLKEVYK